jgi:hypothetical protein
MKNLFILPTDKPTGIFQSNSGLQFSIRDKVRVEPLKGFHICITSNEEIKEGDWIGYLNLKKWVPVKYLGGDLIGSEKKIILTTDQYLISDGVQAIDDEFLEWLVKNPSCEFIEINKEYLSNTGEWKEVLLPSEWEVDTKFRYKIIIPQEEPKQETLEEAAEKYKYNPKGDFCFTKGANYQAKRMYSEEDLRNAFDAAREFNSLNGVVDVHIVLPMGGDMSDLQPLHFTFKEWFEQLKKK